MDEMYVTYVDDDHVDKHDYHDNTDENHENNNAWSSYRPCIGFDKNS